MKRTHLLIYISGIVLLALSFTLPEPRQPSDHPVYSPLPRSRQKAAPTTINSQSKPECTLLLISGRLTTDGRPLLWKNRDVDFINQEFAYFNDGNFDYITIITEGELHDAWGGVNSAGFAIVNSTASNEPDTVQGPDDDGWHIKEALKRCVRVADFAPILDYTNDSGRTLPADYIVMDAYGGGMVYEAAMHTYHTYDLNDSADAPEGFLVRANFSYSGPAEGRIGQWRHDRARDLLRTLIAEENVDVTNLIERIVQDVAPPGFDPYPLPFDTIFPGRGWPPGYIPASSSINRIGTVSSVVIEGVEDGDNPALATLYAMPGQPILTIPIPLWVGAGRVPTLLDGDSSSILCDLSLAFKARIYNPRLALEALNTRQLRNAEGTGLLDLTIPVIDSLLSTTKQTVNRWREDFPTPGQMAEFQDQTAMSVIERLLTWKAHTIIKVPQDYPTLQEAIIAAVDGDTVIAAPGVYPAPVEFLGRNIVVGSYFLLDGDKRWIDSTIIDGNRNGRTLAIMRNGERPETQLVGFTLQNGVTDVGGGVYCSTAWPTLRYLIIKNNRCTRAGAGIYASRGACPIVDHVIIYGDSAANEGGALTVRDSASIVMRNSVIWNNYPAALPANVLLTYCDVDSGHPGNGNIEEEPGFVDAANGNFRITLESPCLDAGDPNSRRDLDGTATDLGVFDIYQRDIDVSRLEITFPDSVGMDSITFSNVGETPLVVDYLEIVTESGDVESFRITGWEGEETLEPGDRRTTSIVFGAIGGDENRALLVIRSDDPDEDSLGVRLEGPGLGINDRPSNPYQFTINSITPNPFNSQFLVNYEVDRAGWIDFTIYDLAGRQVGRNRVTTKSPGRFVLDCDAGGWSSGVFFLKLSDEKGRVLTRKLVQVR